MTYAIKKPWRIIFSGLAEREKGEKNGKNVSPLELFMTYVMLIYFSMAIIWSVKQACYCPAKSL
jgi:hypothetical protein